jgi:hypothetical protein
MRATITVQFRIEVQQLAQFFWDGSPADETCVQGYRRVDVPVSVTHERVISSLRRRGEDYFIENDIYWEEYGGKEWAEYQVRRAYREENNNVD